ncbi:hypothetical protein Riggi_21 [Bacillus phage Riggi]|uniref:Tail terminator protein n=2 Tax=Andromedavirus TaxID=1623275 RepID=M1I9A3_9CAUD|nr:hypothetical protein FINN_19 [Bacillus phage Finn]YP_008770578.1 hypothetical protein Riggi_21 [Bacillus phage Riggi]AGE61012.1 hypothetical protein FINN_19 [Bacillus phage Finn]AGY48183.1 hypothetical protein Riggi_21 [Bacillus phage Riggi]
MSTLSIYTDIKNALRDQVSLHLQDTDYSNIDVFGEAYQDLTHFPAVTLEIKRRRKPIRGLGVRELQMDIDLWVYTNILDSQEAEEECLTLVDLVEQAIEADKSLGGVVDRIDINNDLNFGTVEYGENNFLQGAQIQFTAFKRVP